MEQFEGLYVMMRGFACAFFVGFAYLVGWGLSFHWPVKGMGEAVWLVLVASIAGALVVTGFTIHFEAQAPPADQTERDKLEARKKTSYMRVSIFLLFCGRAGLLSWDLEAGCGTRRVLSVGGAASGLDRGRTMLARLFGLRGKLC